MAVISFTATDLFIFLLLLQLDDHKDINEIWGKLDPANKGEVTKEELKKIKKETLDEVAKYLNYAHTHRPKHDEL